MPADPVEWLFATPLYRAPLGGKGSEKLLDELGAACVAIAEEDEAGQAWSEEHLYPGYTSYASLADLAWRDPSFKALRARLDLHVAAFAEAAAFDLKGRKLELDSLWINILEPGGFHSGHIHPNAAVSGTLYVTVPEGAAPLKLEDPRLERMMAAPPRRADARAELQPFHAVPAVRGQVVLWESWLRHEVPLNASDTERVSVSFNYRW